MRKEISISRVGIKNQQQRLTTYMVFENPLNYSKKSIYIYDRMYRTLYSDMLVQMYSVYSKIQFLIP